MWPSRRSLRGQRNRGRGGEGPTSPVKRSRTVALSAERVLQSLEKVMAMMACRVAKKAIYIVICKKQATYTDRGIKCPA